MECGAIYGGEFYFLRKYLNELSPLGGGHLQVAEFHHKLGFEALRTVITSQVIVEVPGSGAGPPPGGLEPVQVGDQRLHHLALHHLLRPPGGLHSRRVALPTTKIFISFTKKYLVVLHRIFDI